MEKYKAIIYLATCLKENAILNTTRKTTNKKIMMQSSQMVCQSYLANIMLPRLQDARFEANHAYCSFYSLERAYLPCTDYSNLPTADDRGECLDE